VGKSPKIIEVQPHRLSRDHLLTRVLTALEEFLQQPERSWQPFFS
jgi:hypothetical protein